MKATFTLYNGNSIRDRLDSQSTDVEMTLAEMQKVFGQYLEHLFHKSYSVEIEFDYDHCLIPITYIADVLVYQDDTTDDDIQTLEEKELTEIVEALGRLWTEWVRTFVDSGALLAIRVTYGNTQLRWSPHGAE